MKNENILIGIFVKKTRILSFFEFLRYKLEVNIQKVYVYTVDGNENEYLVTFSANRKNDYFSHLHDFTVLHIKNRCLFSINALNIYIGEKKKAQINNTDFNVNWYELRDMLLITANSRLKTHKISKIEDKHTLFNNLLN